MIDLYVKIYNHILSYYTAGFSFSNQSIWLLWEFSVNLTRTGDLVSMVRGERCAPGSITLGLPRRTEDALWSAEMQRLEAWEALGGSCCRNTIPINPIRPDWQWPGAVTSPSFPQLTVQVVAESTFLNFSPFHLMTNFSCVGVKDLHTVEEGKVSLWGGPTGFWERKGSFLLLWHVRKCAESWQPVQLDKHQRGNVARQS